MIVFESFPLFKLSFFDPRSTLREPQGLDTELRMINSSLRSAIAKSMAKQVDSDKEKRKLKEMANDETYSDEQREEVRARLQRFQDEQKSYK